MRTAYVLGIAGFLALPAAVSAASVYLNGTKIDGVRNQEFKGVDVKIDDKGNVLITAQGYEASGGVTISDEKEPANPGAPPTKRYFLITEKAAPGMTQYNIDMYVNAKWVRTLLDEEKGIYLEITEHLKQGDNKIRFIANKKLDGQRRSSSPSHYFRVLVGEGDAEGRQVMIEKKLIEYKRTAYETTTFTNEFTIKVF